MQNWQIFDFHTHIFPDKVAEKAIQLLSLPEGMHACYDGTKGGLLQSMRDAGYDGALNCPIATKVEQVDSINKWAAELNRWPILSLGTIHPDSTDVMAVLEGVQQSGLKGIKLHPEFQNFMLDEARVQPIWDACSQLGLFILFHSGLDASFVPPPKVGPRDIEWLLDSYPDLIVVAGHFGGWKMWDEVESSLIGRNIYLDLAYTVNVLSDVRLVNLIRAHGVDKVLFGTDAPWQEQSRVFYNFRYLPLTATEKKMILWGNAKKLLGFE